MSNNRTGIFMNCTWLTALALCLFSGLLARADGPTPAEPSQEKRDAIVHSLKWQTGAITLKDGLAKINLTDDFKFLGSDDARKVLHDLSGNPDDPSVLGMIFPKEKTEGDEWAVTIHYEEDGYVKDDDADKINYSDLLKQMQQEVLDGNAERQKEGADTAQLIGWAAPPRYDKANHKLYWAKELKFGNDTQDTLNYDIRILGRRGVLVLTVIAAENDFPQIDQKVPEILSMIDFQPGNAYADFDPKIDKVAEYGLTALIAGGALAGAVKLGLFAAFFKWIAVAGAAFYKFLVIGAVAGIAAVKKFWGRVTGKNKTPDHLLPPGSQ